MYFFLDYNVPEGIGWYIGLLILHVAFFYLVYGLYRLKLRLLGESPVKVAQQDQGDEERRKLVHPAGSM